MDEVPNAREWGMRIAQIWSWLSELRYHRHIVNKSIIHFNDGDALVISSDRVLSVEQRQADAVG